MISGCPVGPRLQELLNPATPRETLLPQVQLKLVDLIGRCLQEQCINFDTICSSLRKIQQDSAVIVEGRSDIKRIRERCEGPAYVYRVRKFVSTQPLSTQPLSAVCMVTL